MRSYLLCMLSGVLLLPEFQVASGQQSFAVGIGAGIKI